MKEIILILIPFLIAKESGGDLTAVGDHGEAIGCLQIHRITVDEANRILDGNYFKYSDRVYREKSAGIARVVLYHHSKEFKDLPEEEIIVNLARQWNGGPKGHLKKSTKRYGEAIRKMYLNERKINE